MQSPIKTYTPALPGLAQWIERQTAHWRERKNCNIWWFSPRAVLVSLRFSRTDSWCASWDFCQATGNGSIWLCMINEVYSGLTLTLYKTVSLPQDSLINSWGSWVWDVTVSCLVLSLHQPSCSQSLSGLTIMHANITRVQGQWCTWTWHFLFDEYLFIWKNDCF